MSYYKFEDLIYWKIKKLFDLYEASNKFHTSDLQSINQPYHCCNKQ